MSEISKASYTYQEVYDDTLEYFQGNEFATKVFTDKYSLRSNKVTFHENTPDDMHYRLADEFARVEFKYLNPLSSSTIYTYLKDFSQLIPQGSPMAGIGNPYQLTSISNCFTLPRVFDSISGIYYTDQQLANLYKRRAGVGVSLNNLRPKDLFVHNAAVTTTGIGSWMEQFSDTARTIAENGRRGAEIETLTVHHPEVDTFITIKHDEVKVTGANISLEISDDFMEAVEHGTTYQQRWQSTKNLGTDTYDILKEVNARDVWDSFIHSNWLRGDPGCLFWDTIIRRSPADCYSAFGFSTVGVNPCLTGDSKVAVADGRGSVTIKELADEGLDVPVYCKDNSGNLAIRTMRNPRVTGVDVPVFEVLLDDGNTFKATANHKVCLSDGKTYKEVKDLLEGDSLHIMTKFEASIKDIFPTAKSKSQDYIWLRSSLYSSIKSDHRCIYAFHKGKIPISFVIHHKDYNARNNHISNLQCMSRQDHTRLHADNMFGKDNPMYKLSQDPERLKKYSEKMSKIMKGAGNSNAKSITNKELKQHSLVLTKQLGRRYSVKDWIEYAGKHNLPKAFVDYRNSELGSILDLAKSSAIALGFDPDIDPRLSGTLIKAHAQGYETKIILNEVFVYKSCEYCSKRFMTSYSKREVSFCSGTCSNHYLNKNTDTNERRTSSIHKAYSDKLKGVKLTQLEVYTRLKFNLKREPMLKEWEAECRSSKVPYRLKTKFGFQSFKDLKQEAISFNHRVVSVTSVGNETVYNGTVDDFHNFYFGGFERKNEITGKNESIFLENLQCGEITLSALDSCRLLFINPLFFIKDRFTTHASFDFDGFFRVARVGQRLMDDLVDLEIEKVEAIIEKIKADTEPDYIKQPELDLWLQVKQSCINGRRTGLGISAIGDLVAMLGMKYDSEDSINFVGAVYKTLAMASYTESVNLAKERGAFPIWDYELEKDHEYLTQVISELPLEVQEDYKKYGRRNIANLTTAPVGSASNLLLLGEFNGKKYFNSTSGIEPAFLLEMDRYKKLNPSDLNARVDKVDVTGEKWQKFTISHTGLQLWKDVTGKSDITESPYYGSTANDIDPFKKVDLVSKAIHWVDHSISCTNNLPKSATEEEISKLYMYAYKKGLKGFTIYRDGCRQHQVLNEVNNAKTTSTLVDVHAVKRPEELPCEVHFSAVDKSNWVILIGLMDGKPYEIFGGINDNLLSKKPITNAKIIKRAKGNYSLVYEQDSSYFVIEDIIRTFDNPDYGTHTRLVSTILRTGVPVKYAIEQLVKADKNMHINSFNKVLIRVLSKYNKDTISISSKTCTSCGQDTLIYQEGCLKCINLECGFSKCG